MSDDQLRDFSPHHRKRRCGECFGKGSYFDWYWLRERKCRVCRGTGFVGLKGRRP